MWPDSFLLERLDSKTIKWDMNAVKRWLNLSLIKREVNMKYQADFRFESNSISKEQSKPLDSYSKPQSCTFQHI